MKRIFITSILIIYTTSFFSMSRSLKDPVYLGMILIDLSSVGNMKSVCEY